MPLPQPSPRVKLAAMSLAGALMVALPTAQVLRYQGEELRAAQAARAGLDPLTRATALQRGLLAHRDAAADVLRGHAAREAERRVREGEVDDRAEALAQAVALLAPQPAIDEAAALREDWAALVARIVARSLDDRASDDAHRLLVEQTLQIIDLVVDPLVGAADAAAVLIVAAGQARQAALAALGGGTDAADADQALAQAEAVQRRLGALLVQRQDTLHRERQALLAALALLGGVAAAAAWSLRRRPQPPGAPGSASTAPSSDRDEAQRLLHRLRRDSAAGQRGEDQHTETMPPPR